LWLKEFALQQHMPPLRCDIINSRAMGEMVCVPEKWTGH
jgi:hypothetical protein